MTARRVATVLGASLVLPALAAAQGLGDAAASERAKRQAPKKAEVKVFTNDDLEQGRPAGTPAPGEGSSSPAESPAPLPDAGAETGSREPSAGEDRRAQEQPYVDAVIAAESRLNQIEARIRELQAKLNPMSTTFIYGDFNNTGTDKVAEEAEVRSELNEAEGQLNQARQAAAEATRALQDFRQGRSSTPSANH